MKCYKMDLFRTNLFVLKKKDLKVPSSLSHSTLILKTHSTSLKLTKYHAHNFYLAKLEFSHFKAIFQNFKILFEKSKSILISRARE